MGPETKQTIRRAWADLLDVEELDGGDRVMRVVPDAATVSFVRVFGQGVLTGPAWALERADNLRDDELRLLPVLMRLAADHGARPLGAAELSYTDVRVEHADLAMTEEEDAVAALEAACSPADVDEVGLGSMPHRWVLLDGLEDAGARAGAGSARRDAPVSGATASASGASASGASGATASASGASASGADDASASEGPVSAGAPTPLAGAGYVVWADRLAHMGVLTSPQARGRGYGVLAAAVGTNAALDAGLVPQWRTRWDNEASKRIAQVLGYELVGSQTTVYIDS